MNTLTSSARFRQRVIKKSYKIGVTRAANYYRISRQAIYEWREKYDGKSWKSLVDRSHRPHHHPNEHTIVIVSTVYFLLIKLSNKNKIETEHQLLTQQYNLQAKYVEEIKEQYTKIQKIRHDFSNTFNIIQKLLNDNKNTEAEEYIAEYFKKTKRNHKNNSYK